MRPKGLISPAVALFILQASVLPLFSQAVDPNELTRSVIQKKRKAIVAKNMALNDSEAQSFWPMYSEYRAGMAKLVDRTLALIDKYASSYETLSEDLAMDLLKEYMKIEGGRLRLKNKYVNEFRRILPTNKVVRFFQVDNKLDAIVAYDLARSIPLVQ